MEDELTFTDEDDGGEEHRTNNYEHYLIGGRQTVRNTDMIPKPDTHGLAEDEITNAMKEWTKPKNRSCVKSTEHRINVYK